MRKTNRALNRTLLALLGVVLAGAGAALIAAVVVPGFAQTWTSTGNRLRDQSRELLTSAPLADPPRSWWAVVAVAALLVAAALSVGWLVSQGGGRTARLAEVHDGDRGRTVVDTGLINSAVQEAVKGNREILASSVSAWELRKGTAIKLRIEARKGASPRELVETAELLVQPIDTWLGGQTPVLVRITAGTRSRLAGTGRAR
ncbi:hypothetical protein ACPFL9_00845 [Paenarthrobacter sp. NyZ202]|uniref:hypothetical protein n=1 Tax=Paenarthrobacter sp. NyZ202 TaxID=3402689 RepID=UPI003CED04C4